MKILFLKVIEYFDDKEKILYLVTQLKKRNKGMFFQHETDNFYESVKDALS